MTRLILSGPTILRLCRDCMAWTRLSSIVVTIVLVFAGGSCCGQDQTQAAAPPESDQVATVSAKAQNLILVRGADGTPEYGAEFSKWADRWIEAAKAGHVDVTAIGLSEPSKSEAPAVASENADGRETTDKDRLLAAIRQYGTLSGPEPLWIVYLGHGTFNQKAAALALRGPDVTSEELADACRGVTRPLIVIACSSCSAPLINALTGPGRVIVSATKDGQQVQYSRFGDAFSIAISTLEADINRDGETSLLEAWLFASRRTAEFYSTAGRLATEHSLLEDNGDARGVRSELYSGDKVSDKVKSDEPVDGSSAARLFFVRSAEEQTLTPDERLARDALEAQLEDLKKRRSMMDDADYLQQLERIFVPLAEIYRSAAARASVNTAPADAPSSMPQ